MGNLLGVCENLLTRGLGDELRSNGRDGHGAADKASIMKHDDPGSRQGQSLPGLDEVRPCVASPDRTEAKRPGEGEGPVL